VLRGRSAQAIVDALTSGSMRYQGLSLSGAERRAIAEFLTGKKLRGSVTGATTGRCARPPPLSDPAAGPLWNGWGPTPQNTHFQPAPQAGLTAAQVPQLKLKWAFGFPDATSSWAQPSIAGGRVFIGSQNGTVYSLDATSGCIARTPAREAAPAVARPRRPTLQINRATSTRWTRRPVDCCGAAESTTIRSSA